MNNFFNLDNGFFAFLSKACDIIFLSLIWLIICIPIVTIGPANTALYYATVKVIRRERGYLMREFFRSFRLNFKRGAIVGIALTAIYAILVFDLFMARAAVSGNMNSVFLGIYLVLIIFASSFSIYVFPVLSRFDLTVKQLVKTSLFMSMKHLPFTVIMLIVSAAAIAGVIYIPFLILLLPATAVYINSLLMERIFKKYMPKTENTDTETKKDEWYLE